MKELLILVAVTIVLDIVSFLLYKNSIDTGYNEPTLKVKHVILLYFVPFIIPPISIVVTSLSIVNWAINVANNIYKFKLLDKHPKIKKWLNKDIV